jgi:hypothetical protein
LADSTYDFAPQEPQKPEPEKPAPEEKAERQEEPSRLPPLPPDALKEWTCPHCGIKRLGKPAKGRCPECSGQMEVGAAADLLQFARAGWIRNLSNGAFFAALGLLAHVVAAILGPWRQVAWVVYLQIGAAAALALGLFLLTAPERGGQPQRRPSAGQAARWLAVGAMLLWVALWWIFQRQGGATSGAVRLMLVLLCVVQAGVALAGGFFLSGLSGRIPHDSLMNQFLNIAWLVPAVLAFVVIDAFVGLQAQFGFLFYCVFPTMGVMAALILWPAAALLQLGLELRNAAVAADAIVAKREARAAAANK